MIFQSILNAFRVRERIPTANVYDDNVNGDATIDRFGNLFVREGIGPQTGTGAFTEWMVPAIATAVITNVPTILTQVGGFNDSAGNIYVQLFDQAVALVGGESPVMTFFVPMNASFSWTPSRGGRLFGTGLVFGVSSTKNTYTALATSIFMFAEGYLPTP